ncbi:extracellular solute-binding protein [bacterium]|nr:extracellular solute-binding protein [bacterium]
MRSKRLFPLIGLLIVLSMVLAACPAPAAPAGGDQGAAEPASTEPAAEAPAAEEAASGDTVTIEYWQYNFPSRIEAMDLLIEQFEAANPGIDVIHNSDVPYSDFEPKIASSVPAGVGPDVVSLFYGWQIPWIDSGYIVPLPEDAFPAEMVASEFSSMVEASYFDGELYTLPTAVRTLALFYNKDLMEQAGLDPESPPTTLEELQEQAVQCTVKNGDDFEVYGFIANPGGQAHHWFREVLLRQFGQQPYSDDRRTVLWNASEAGYEAWEAFLSFETELGTGRRDFENDQDGFLAGQVCFHIDGSFRLPAVRNVEFDWGVAELPTFNGLQSTFGSYWTHGITSKAVEDPARFDAAVKFMQFITNAEAGRLWVDIVGELPAQLEAAADPVLQEDPGLGAFIAGLPYASATFFVNEADDRQAIIDAYDAVILSGADPRAELDFAVETVQEMFDEFWADR